MSGLYRKVLTKKVLYLSELPEVQITNRRVFVRVDFNVPISDGEVKDDTRIRAALKTINYLIEKKAIIILASHLGRPKGKPDKKYSLEPVCRRLSELVKQKVKFIPYSKSLDFLPYIQRNLQPGEICLLENLRFHKEEEENDFNFSKDLSRLGELYVNEAFGTSHRAHSSTTGIVEYLRPAVAGVFNGGRTLQPE